MVKLASDGVEIAAPQGGSKPSSMTSAVLAFFLGIVGADFFYRREFLSGFAVIAILVFGYAAAPLMGEGTAGLLQRIPPLLVLYGWVRAYLYSKSKGL